MSENVVNIMVSAIGNHYQVHVSISQRGFFVFPADSVVKCNSREEVMEYVRWVLETYGSKGVRGGVLALPK